MCKGRNTQRDGTDGVTLGDGTDSSTFRGGMITGRIGVDGNIGRGVC